MKKLIALIGVALLLVGIRLYDTGITRIAADGCLTVFAATEYSPAYFIPTGADCYRIDLPDKEDAERLLRAANAEVRFTEMDGRLIYAYSPRIPRVEWVHGKRVNLMIYSDDDRVCVGVPLLKGSY